MTAAIVLQFFFLALLDPAVRRNTIVRRMGRIGEVNRGVLALSSLNPLIRVEKDLLLIRVLLAGNMGRLLIGKTSRCSKSVTPLSE